MELGDDIGAAFFDEVQDSLTVNGDAGLGALVLRTLDFIMGDLIFKLIIFMTHQLKK